MLTVEEARAEVLGHARPLPPRRLPLAEAMGCVLAEDAAADIDSPPFDKAIVDGYALRAADAAGQPPIRLMVGEEIPAGRTPGRPLAAGEAAVIMTGAPLPEGADAVVMIEFTRRDGPAVLIEPPQPIRPGQNWMPRGREMRAGETVLTSGTILNPVALGVLASVGASRPLVHPGPLVRIVPTGDELVEPDQAPGPGQIRNSNATMLRALVENHPVGRTSAEVGPIAGDDPEALAERLHWGLDADALLVTGGVSAGKRDLVPETLAKLGVVNVFHKIRLKPGKPLWFGIGPPRTEGRPGTLVFGLPGNPVSSLVGFHLFVAPALNVLSNRSRPARTEPERLPLAGAYRHRGDRPTYHPAHLQAGEHGTGRQVALVDWAGSADLRALAGASHFAIFPPGDHDYRPGDLVPIAGPFQ